MTRSAKKPEKFEKGQRLTAAALNSIVDAVVKVLRQMFGNRISQPLNKMAVLDANLDAATSKANSPATATASIWQKNASGNLADTGENETVVNRFENISLTSGTLIKIEWIDGEWQPYASDCD